MQLYKHSGTDIVIYVPPVTHMVIRMLSTKLSALAWTIDLAARAEQFDADRLHASTVLRTCVFSLKDPPIHSRQLSFKTVT